MFSGFIVLVVFHVFMCSIVFRCVWVCSGVSDVSLDVPCVECVQCIRDFSAVSLGV